MKNNSELRTAKSQLVQTRNSANDFLVFSKENGGDGVYDQFRWEKCRGL
jgi:hypothetical protein